MPIAPGGRAEADIAATHAWGAAVHPARAGAGRLGGTAGQWLTLSGLAGLGAVSGLWFPEQTADAVIIGFWSVFTGLAVWRAGAVLIVRRLPPPAPPPLAGRWPRYTIVAALRHEAAMIDQLVARLARLDYPAGRLEGFLVIEADDAETLAAASAAARPPWLHILVAPPGVPRTKPRALNIALTRATGQLLTIYDAEDEPHPLQLREAAGRFAASDDRLACLQAPLRIRTARADNRVGFLQRQFAIEYAALFEVMIPAMAALGLPFPLGGTSNHFRVDVLRGVGGWDPWNVTEDADLGFRLTAAGWRLGVLEHPTWETAPDRLADWLPQRARWIKGYMQTWGVHMRAPWRLGWRGFLALQLTLGLGILSAMLHAPSLGWVATTLLVALFAFIAPVTPWAALATLMTGVAAAWLTCAVGARRAGARCSPVDLLASPAYWALQGVAFVHAGWRLLRAPHAWDKTPHTPDPVEAAGRQAA